jgi:twitching motility protein PilT
VTQRELGNDTHEFAQALKDALRQDPDVIMVGEMRDLETIALAITLAETGVLIFGTLHTNSAAKTIDRVIDVFPAARQQQVRTMLASSLRAIVAQQLLRRAGGTGRIAAHEILIASPALGNIIREGRTEKISSYLQSGRSEGMITMDRTLRTYLEQKLITGEEAYMFALDKSQFQEHFSHDIEPEEDEQVAEAKKAKPTPSAEAKRPAEKPSETKATAPAGESKPQAPTGSRGTVMGGWG